MGSFFIFALAFIAVAVRNVMKKGGPPTGGLHGHTDTRRGTSRRSAPPYRASRLPPPPSARPSSLPPPPPDDEPVAAGATPDGAEFEPEPEPVEAVASEPVAQPEPEPPAEPDVDLEPTSSPDAPLDLLTVIRAVFGDEGSARERAERFESDYAGRRVSWTAHALGSFTTRRDRVQVERVELFLGHTTEEGRFSDRVMAEAFFADGTAIERDTDIAFTATLTEAKVYARRLVLDHAEID